jgi:hypothetical protein
MTTSLIPAAVTDQIQLAQTLAHSNLLPEQYRKQPANLLWAVQYAQALGVHPMTAITGIAVINGKPTASAQLIGGLVRRAGHKLRVETSDTKAVATIIRADDPDFEFRVEWTMDRAKRAGLGGRGPWQQYPAAMLAARAITEVARMAAPEALFGIIYTAEELGADVDDEGTPQGAAFTAPAKPVAPGTRERVETETGNVYDIVYEEAAEPTPAPVNEIRAMPKLIDRSMTHDEPTADEDAAPARSQVTRIAILRKELGLSDDTYRDRIEKLYGVRSSKELTRSQAADLIEKLTAASKKTQRGADDDAAV